MFEKFGEMDSYEEINKLAENLANEGDMDSLREMAQENGIDADMADLYVQGEIPYLCDPVTAAVGKIDLEAKQMKIQGIMEDWAEYIRASCAEDEEIALQVRKKEKSLEGCIAELLKWSFANQWPVPDKIIKAAGINAGRVTLGIPGMGQAKKIIREYYTEEKE